MSRLLLFYHIPESSSSTLFFRSFVLFLPYSLVCLCDVASSIMCTRHSLCLQLQKGIHTHTYTRLTQIALPTSTMSAPSLLRVAQELVCAFLVLLVVSVSAVTFTTFPPMPVLDVPFCVVQDSDLTAATLFISTRSDCSTATVNAGGLADWRWCNILGSIAFNVSSAAMTTDLTMPQFWLPPTYWCRRENASSARGTRIGTLEMNVITTNPTVYPRGQRTSFTFSNAIPVDSIVQFVVGDGTCTQPLEDGGPFTLGLDRTVEVTLSGLITGVCTIYFSPLSSDYRTTMTLRSTISGYNPFTVTPAFSAPNTSVYIVDRKGLFYYTALSDDKNCGDLPTPKGVQVDDEGRLYLRITKPLGTYYFCVTDSLKVYYPATNMFTVVEYGVQPNFAYTGKPAKAYPSKNTPSSTEVALFSTTKCSTNPIQDWASFSEATWDVSQTGTFYACVRPSGTTWSLSYAYAGPVTIVPPPTVVVTNPSAIVRGCEVEGQLIPAVYSESAYRMGLSSSPTCASFYRDSTELYDNKASFTLGQDAADTMYWCVTIPMPKATADTEATTPVSYVAVSPMTVRDFQLSYPALRRNVSASFTLDRAARLPDGAAVAFVRVDAGSCALVSTVSDPSSVVPVSVYRSNNTLSSAVFVVAGKWRMCVSSYAGSSYGSEELASVYVYEKATVSPAYFIARMTTPLSISGLQPGEGVAVIADGESCSSTTRRLAEGVANSSGVAALIVTYDGEGSLQVCATYPGFQDGVPTAPSWYYTTAVSSSTPRVFPAVAEMRAGVQVLRVVAAGASSLVGQHVFLSSPNLPCLLPTTTEAFALPRFATVLTPLQLSNEADTLTTTLTLNANMIDVSYRACVETNGTYVDGGIIAVTRTSLQQAAPVALVSGQLALLTFPASYTRAALVDTYVVVEGAMNCTSDLGNATIYATGSIDPNTGRATEFVAPSPTVPATSRSLRVCLAPSRQLANSTYGYVDGGTFTSSTFTAINAYVQSSLDGGVTGWPVLRYAVQYLVSCSGDACKADAAAATCRSNMPQYPITLRTSTSSRPGKGTYLLCQRVEGATGPHVVGSNTTVTVVDTYAMTSPADLTQLRTSQLFDATLTGGDGSGTSMEVVVQPLSVPCGKSSTESQAFFFTIGVGRSLALTALTAYTLIHFCVQPRGAYADAFEVATGALYSYSSPSYISFSSLNVSGTVTVTLPTLVGRQGMLSSSQACGDVIDGGAATFAVNGAFTFTVPPCGANAALNVVHFCEVSDSSATYRGSLLLLRSSSCFVGDESAAIQPVTVAPGTPIANVGVNSKFLFVTGLSRRSDCSATISVSGATGYVPSAGEDAIFFVCTYPIGAPTVTFTTIRATLSVMGYAVEPAVVRSPLNVARSMIDRTLITLSAPLPPGYTFFGSGASCLRIISDADGMNTSAASALYDSTAQCGTVFVCWQETPASAAVAVAQFTSVTTPELLDFTIALVRGATFNASFASVRCLSAAQTTSTRVYLSADQCVSVLDGTTAGTDALHFTTAISSSLLPGLSTVSLCVAASPAGAATVIAGLPVAPGEVYPISVTAGTPSVRFFIPRYPGGHFWFATTSAACDIAEAAMQGLRRFTTDGSGYATVSISNANGAVMAEGSHALCYSPFSWSSSFSLSATSGNKYETAVFVGTVQVTQLVFYDVYGTAFVIGVPSKMTLHGDLTTANLWEGFSTASDCSELSTAYGTWSSVTGTSIMVTARQAPPPVSPSSRSVGLFLCAYVPSNLSVVALPNAFSATATSAQSLTFADSMVQIPAAGFDVCANYTLPRCVTPTVAGGGVMQSPSTQLTVVFGDCCNAANQAGAVGNGIFLGGTCSLSFSAALVRRYPAQTVFSLCAWDPIDASVCATLNRITVNTTCRGEKSAKRERGLSSGAMASIVIGCIFGGVALAVAILFALCYFGCWGCSLDKCSLSSYISDGWSTDFTEGHAKNNFGSSSGRGVEVPPEGNNYGTQGPLGRSTDAAEMRHNVLVQVAMLSSNGTGSNSNVADDTVSLDSWAEPRDTNFMDDCEELREKYVHFFHSLPYTGPEEISDFPATAFLRRTQADREALFDEARRRNQAAAASTAGDLNLSWDELVRQSDVLYHMERSHPFAKTLFIFFEEQNCVRTAVEISEDTDFFNLRTLFKSHVAELDARKAAAIAAAAATCNGGGDDEPTTLTPKSSRTLSGGPMPSSSLQSAWLHRHRHKLEFPWVTNNFRTLVGYRKGDGLRYDYVDWDLPLLDLQAFHPLHRWWSPLLPPAARSTVDDDDARFAFMRPTSTVPFVRRYLLLFEVEFRERAQIARQEKVLLVGLRNTCLDLQAQLEVSMSESTVLKKAGTSTTTTFASSCDVETEDDAPTLMGQVNPLHPEGPLLRDKLASA